jgi:hypothetical protein
MQVLLLLLLPRAELAHQGSRQAAGRRNGAPLARVAQLTDEMAWAMALATAVALPPPAAACMSARPAAQAASRGRPC